MTAPDPFKCAHRGCPGRVIGRVVPQYGAPWLVCADHKDPVMGVFAKFDNRQSSGSRFEPRPERRAS